MVTNDVDMDHVGGVVDSPLARQKNDQLGAGEIALLVAIPSEWYTGPVSLIPDWLRRSCWVKGNKDRDGRRANSGGAPPE